MTGLVVEGGGMKCAYSAGILDKFIDDGISFDYCIGVSAGSANACSYLAGQRGRNLRFYTDHISAPEYFGFKSFLKTGDLFNLKFIYGDLTNSDGEDPLDLSKILANPTKFQVVATNAQTGLPRYFDKSEIQQDDYRIIMASCAIPAACRPVEVNGNKYYDGGVSDSIPFKKAFSEGCDKVVVILSKNRDFVKTPEKSKLFYTMMCHKYPKIIDRLNNRHIKYTKQMKEMFELEKEGKIFLFAPSEHLAMSTYAMDAPGNQALYDLALKDYAKQENDLKKFMEK